MHKKEENELIKVINGGYCIGCGACAVVAPDHIQICEGPEWQYQAKIDPSIPQELLSTATMVCPFTNQGPNEDILASELYECNETSFTDVIGFYRKLYTGHVAEGSFREKCTSGGIITWTLTQLLKRGMVDSIIHVKRDSGSEKLFSYGISSTEEEVLAGAKSRYYPVTLAGVLTVVKANPGRYALVGPPCFIKSARKLEAIDPALKKNILFHIGIVCGHLKTKAFTDLFGWQVGIHPGEVRDIDFRVKLPEQRSCDYGVRVTGPDGVESQLIARECFGTNWGHNFFKYEACDYCDDIFSETADLTVGDAWLQEFFSESRGTSVVVVRSSALNQILDEGVLAGQLSLQESSVDQICRSQAGGIRHRRQGLQYRLYIKSKRKRWVPQKRVPESKPQLIFRRRLIYRYRMFLRKKSAIVWGQAVANNDFNLFRKRLAPHLLLYRRLLSPFASQAINFFKKFFVRKQRVF